ncbi:hypothetical protein C5S30_07895, partial [ANME-1 cluster archaeon GoMg4]|nr:hypothetical protein [ANME-1 cluster archaeon GoMg4]
KPETDNVIGEMVRKDIFKGSDEIELEGDVETRFEELKHRILDLAKEDIIGVLSSSTANSQTKKAKKL